MKNKLNRLPLILAILFSSMLCVQLVNIPENGKIYLDPEFGQHTATGTQNAPLKSLFEAAVRVNSANGTEAITILLAPGIYGLDATVTFQPEHRQFTREDRLTIRAEILPDDTGWDPWKMPVIVSTMPLNFEPNGNPDPLGGTSYGLLKPGSTGQIIQEPSDFG